MSCADGRRVTDAEIQRMIPKVRNTARRFASIMHLNASDLESVALTALAQAQKGFDPDRGTAFSTYVYTAVHNQMLRAAHHLGRELTVLDCLGVDDSGETFADLIPDESSDPANLAIDLQQSRDLWRAVAALPPQEAQVVRMRFLQSLSVREIAVQLGLKRSRTNKILNIAFRRLAQSGVVSSE